MNIHEAQKVLKLESKRLWEKELHPNGSEREFYISYTGTSTIDLPNIGITLYANGTWEYTDPELRDEEDD